MKFENKQEAFNYWNTRGKNELETRAKEIKTMVETDPEADILSLNIEMEGLREVMANIDEKTTETIKEDIRSFNPVTGAEFRADLLPADPISSKEYRSAFFKNLKGEDLTVNERKIFNEVRSTFNSSENTGNVIPEQTLNEIVRRATDEGGLIAYVRSFSIPSYVSIPVGTPNSKAIWHKEGEPVETENIEVNNVTFEGHELIKLFSISNKLKNMSITAFESYLVDELSNCMLQTIADSLINGSGEGQGTGLLNGIEWDESNSIKTDSDLTYKDIIKAISLLHRGYSKEAKFIMNNRTFYNSIYGMVDDIKRPIFISDPTEKGKGTILGYPVIIDDFMPDGTIIFGDPKYMGYNLPQGITLDSSDQSSYRSALIDFRAIAITDCKPIVDEAFIKLEAGEGEPLTAKRGQVVISNK